MFTHAFLLFFLAYIVSVYLMSCCLTSFRHFCFMRSPLGCFNFLLIVLILCRCDPGRRTALPAPGTDNSHIGIMTILYNNIGKDLSRVSMPVALNEPVSLLQRLSEELEYSELLDIANCTDDPYERMVSLVYLDS